MIDYVDLWINVEEVYSKLDKIYEQGEAYIKLNQYRLARERFMKAEIEDGK